MFFSKKGKRIYFIVFKNVTKEFKKLALITQKAFTSKWQRAMGQLEGYSYLHNKHSNCFPCEIGKPDKYVCLPTVFYWKTKLIILFGWLCWPEFYQWLKWSLSLKLLGIGVPGWLSWLSVRLRLRSRSHSLWVRALHRALCWQLRAWSLLRILCFPLSLPLSCSYSVSLSQK